MKTAADEYEEVVSLDPVHRAQGRGRARVARFWEALQKAESDRAREFVLGDLESAAWLDGFRTKEQIHSRQLKKERNLLALDRERWKLRTITEIERLQRRSREYRDLIAGMKRARRKRGRGK